MVRIVHTEQGSFRRTIRIIPLPDQGTSPLAVCPDRLYKCSHKVDHGVLNCESSLVLLNPVASNPFLFYCSPLSSSECALLGSGYLVGLLTSC